MSKKPFLYSRHHTGEKVTSGLMICINRIRPMWLETGNSLGFAYELALPGGGLRRVRESNNYLSLFARSQSHRNSTRLSGNSPEFASNPNLAKPGRNDDGGITQSRRR